MKHRGVGHIRIATIHTPRANHTERRLTSLHGANLHWRGMGAQQGTGIEIESIVHSTGRVVARNIERFEVVVIVLNLRALLYGVAGTGEEFFDTLQCASHRMQSTQVLTSSGPGWIASGDSHTAAYRRILLPCRLHRRARPGD